MFARSRGQGECSIRLAGGQRQSVGIGRAFDSVTDDAVMDAIHTLMDTKSISVIAHRITTLRQCDRICLIERGRIVAEGNYERLVCVEARVFAKEAG